MTLAASDLYRAIDGLTAALAAVPPIDLSPEERVVHSGHIFRDADRFVRDVAAALSSDPALFDDIAADPRELVGLQDRARAFLRLHHALSFLARRAMDGYLLDQASAARAAMEIVRQVRAEAERPAAPPRARRRQRALLVAEQALRQKAHRKGTTRRRPGAPSLSRLVDELEKKIVL